MGPTPQHQRRCRSRPPIHQPDRVRARGVPFAGGAIANFGGYSNSTSHTLTNHLLTSNNMQTMYSWQDCLPAQLPMTWRPQADCRRSENANDLMGATPLSHTLGVNPEDQCLVK